MENLLDMRPEELQAYLKEFFKPRQDMDYFRVITSTHDSGWRLTGRHVETNVKHYARTRGIGHEGYYLTKRDFLDVTSPDSALYQSEVPLPIWHNQESWNNNFPLPDDLQQQKKKTKSLKTQDGPSLTMG